LIGFAGFANNFEPPEGIEDFKNFIKTMENNKPQTIAAFFKASTGHRRAEYVHKKVMQFVI
jgi:hypothetical protein